MASGRAHGIDVLRGTVMVLMVLDHARDFFVGLGRDPTDLATTTLPLFFTRLVTHFCAPVFVLLAGVSAQLYAQKRGLAAVRRFLWTRGLWLILLELTVVRFAWIPEPFFRMFLLQVIWVLGWSMLALSALSWLPLRVVVTLGALVLLGHNALGPLDRAHFGAAEPLWNLLHERALLTFGTRRAFVSYPLLPWIGVIAVGYGIGSWYQLDATVRRRFLTRAGVIGVCAFVALRALNLYGDPEPWSWQSKPGFTLVSFLNCEKYPPSLAFLLMTLGPALLLLAWLDGWTETRGRWLVVFGRVPLFFYVAHLYLLRFSAAPLALWRFGSAGIAPPPGHAGSPEYPLWAAYLAWLTALALLYPACLWFGRKKAHGTEWWWSYL